MRTIALALMIAVPSSGWGQVVTSPSYPQSDAPVTASLVPPETTQVVEVSPPALYQRWYFWTGVGATLTGVIVSAVLVSLASSKPPLTQSQVCGGRCDACIGFACN